MQVGGVGCCAIWKSWSPVVQGLGLKSKVVERVTTSSLSIRIGVFLGVEPSLCTPKVCRHKHPLGSFPLFPDRCCCWKLTSLSTGTKSEFWPLRYAFNCGNLFFVFDFGGMTTCMLGNLKEAKLAKIHMYEVCNQAKLNFELFRVYFGVKLIYYIHLPIIKTHRVDARLFFFKIQNFFKNYKLKKKMDLIISMKHFWYFWYFDREKCDATVSPSNFLIKLSCLLHSCSNETT